MGAWLWHHSTAWHPEPAEALRALQAAFLKEKYDLPTLLTEHLLDARQAVEAAESEGDPYGIAGIFRDKVRLLERLCGQSIPDEPHEQIEILRRINADSGEGIGNVLDVTGISASREVHTTQWLSESEIVRLVGVAQPTLAQATSAIDTINNELGRGESLCFPIFSDDNPMGWYFVGNTID